MHIINSETIRKDIGSGKANDSDSDELSLYDIARMSLKGVSMNNG